MKKHSDSIDNRRNILEKLIDKPPFRYEKSSDGGSIDNEETENIVNISFTRTRRGDSSSINNSQNSNEHYHTTINLFINDPLMAHKKCEGCTCNSRKNDVLLGKNIPSHNLMENLLSDLHMKKYSSAPNMKQLKNGFSNSSRSRVQTRVSQRKTSKIDKTENKKMSLLYMNDKGDFQKMHIDNIIGTNNEEITECENIEHPKNEYKFREQNVEIPTQLETRNVITSERKLNQNMFYPENTGILYRDTITAQTYNEKPTQPRRKVPAFRPLTQTVDYAVNMKQECVNSYYSKLMKNQKQMFETLRHVNFQQDAQEKECKPSVTETNEMTESHSLLPSQAEDNTRNLYVEPELAFARIRGENDVTHKEQTVDTRNGKNSKLVCSVESHGSYDEYRRNLIKRPDGTMCCRNTREPEDDVWSRAETRSIITTEFIKDKIRRFERIASKKSRNPEYLPTNESNNKKQINSDIHIYEKTNELPLIPEKESSSMSFSNENVKSISFPKETKNAMMRLLAENLNNNPTYNRLKSRARKWSNQLSRSPAGSQQYTKPRHTVMENEDINTRFWSGMAERVQARPEENTP